MSFLKKLFGGGDRDRQTAPEARAAAGEVYEGFTITPTPIKDGSQYRLAAEITKAVDGEVRSHRLVRADMFPTEDEAVQYALRKARQVIDEQGDALLAS
ncbi:HlyU family transcriptional regulator [Mangrovibrevibacter kandeliae]|uniref:HlyU family transcriptional regulator n=1 Tax=Mangrovibrevibacter kandeliae TaxID=2968473 RepID=UPI00211755BC|nr:MULTISPECIES: HlyU family transcriptional regulator [unclassified Aurantimonas]MCQ8784117.1 HlyU family transcriptional regulator [Aurantimonas sp. CSK15Z-1]MCW4116836.1 HlyU family transcriptional regulator [Aurantimonas sp. MSK8Z-1]